MMTSAFFLEKFCQKELMENVGTILILYYHLLTYPVPVPSKKYKVYKSSINKSLHFAQKRLSSSTRG